MRVGQLIRIGLGTYRVLGYRFRDGKRPGQFTVEYDVELVP